MSDSPPKNESEAAEQGAQSGEEPDQMDREQEGAQQGLGDFEVKEQDRWLPIANGWFCFNFREFSKFVVLRVFPFLASFVFDLFVPCVTLLRVCALTMALCEPPAVSLARRATGAIPLIRLCVRPFPFVFDHGLRSQPFLSLVRTK
jgi:hypothetical protein